MAVSETGSTVAVLLDSLFQSCVDVYSCSSAAQPRPGSGAGCIGPASSSDSAAGGGSSEVPQASLLRRIPVTGAVDVGIHRGSLVVAACYCSDSRPRQAQGPSTTAPDVPFVLAVTQWPRMGEGQQHRLFFKR